MKSSRRSLALWVVPVAYVWATVLTISTARDVTPESDVVYIEGKHKLQLPTRLFINESLICIIDYVMDSG